MEERKELNDNDQFKLDRLKKIKELTDDICYKTLTTKERQRKNKEPAHRSAQSDYTI